MNTAKWIWQKGENLENTWMNFVKTIELTEKPESAIARIAVDSKYWLYINGDLVVFEGGLKRGPSLSGTYYDELIITDYLTSGKNTIAVLVWYFGKNGFSHKSSGQGGLCFEGDVDSERIISDDTWKIKRNPAYVERDAADMLPNFRLPEPNIYFDAAKALGQWYAADYDTSDWENADIVGAAGDEPWGKLVKGGIPQLKDYGLKYYENAADYKGFTALEDTVLELRLPYNAQFTPYLEITAVAGKKLVMKTENYDTIVPEEKCLMSVYYTKEGRQEYEALGWINGERAYYLIPAGVTVHELKYRETGYNTSFVGSFVCDDEFMNKLWQKSLRTLYVTMRDTFMDCPDRERVQWWGDVNVEMQMMMYCLDDDALLLYKKGVDSLAGWADDCGYMLTVVPSGTTLYELPLQNLAGIWGFSYYYDYTGDISVLERIYPVCKSYVLSYKMDSDGLTEHRSGSWDWADWGDNADVAVMENAWYYMALSACKKMAKLLGEDADIYCYETRLRSVKEGFYSKFWTGDYYYEATANGKPDDRANALAVLSGLADSSQYNAILKVLKSTENASPYMEKYVLDALCEMGCIDDALKRMKRRYGEMVAYSYSTLWEYWTTEGTRNHAWSGGPLITMSKYIAGIRPLDTAYSRFEIKPHIGELQEINCTVPSIRGEIVLAVSRNSDKINMDVNIPEGTMAEVYLPLINNVSPRETKYDFELVDGYAKFILSSGVYNLCT